MWAARYLQKPPPEAKTAFSITLDIMRDRPYNACTSTFYYPHIYANEILMETNVR